MRKRNSRWKWPGSVGIFTWDTFALEFRCQRGLIIPRWILLLLCVCCITACTFQYAPGDSSTGTPAADAANNTLTAIHATNTQIALWRTQTAIVQPPIVLPTQPALSLTAPTPLPTAAPLATLVIITDTPWPTQPAIPPTSTSPPLPTPTPLPTGDLRLTYNSDHLTLYNISNRPINLAGLSFYSDSGTMEAAQWDNGYLTAPLGAFPAGDCLMAWSVTMTEQPRPSDCDTRHAWIAVNDTQDFWRASRIFEVRQYGQAFAVCTVQEGQCYLSLP